jgi:acyl carrier protein
MTRDEIVDRVNRTLLREFDVTADLLKPEARLGEDLGLDSLDGIDLVVALEKEFKDRGIKIQEDQARSLTTLGAVYDCVTGTPADPAPRWTGRMRGGVVGNWLYLAVLRLFGLRVAYLFLVFVAAYFLLAARPAVRSSAEYLQRLMGPLSFFRRLARVYRHFFAYGVMLLDRVAILRGREGAFAFDFDGESHLREALAANRGLILLASHTGNWEAAGHLLRRLAVPCSVVGVDREIEPIRRLFDDAMTERHVRLIAVEGAFEHSVEILAALRRGEIVALLGDRAAGPAPVRATFLGREAAFPAGPYLLAAVTGAPLVHAFAFREAGFRYRFVAFPPERLEMPARDRRAAYLADCVRTYVTRLETMVRQYPYQWYNFYPFWEPIAGGTGRGGSEETEPLR